MTQGNRSWTKPALTPLRLIIILAVVLIGWLLSGFYDVKPNQRGVVTRFGKLVGMQDQSGRFHARKIPPGLHWKWPWPIDRVYTPKTTDVKRIEVGFKHLGELFS